MHRLGLVVLLTCLGLLMSCNRDEVVWTMIPAPIIMRDARFDFARLVTPENQNPRPARVTSLHEFGAMGGPADQAFIAAIDRQLESSRTGEAVIYIPGYRVTFDHALYEAAPALRREGR